MDWKKAIAEVLKVLAGAVAAYLCLKHGICS